MAEATVYLNIWGRPDVKIPEKYRKYQAPTDIRIIPMDWDKEVTVEAVNPFKAWAKKIGVGY